MGLETERMALYGGENLMMRAAGWEYRMSAAESEGSSPALSWNESDRGGRVTERRKLD